MRIIVCVKQLADGSLNPFDASALECALSLNPDRVTILTMGRKEAASMLEELTRLGPIDAVLLSDSAFAGADTLATAYALSHWLQKEQYDLILCGRQSIDGETAQVGPELASKLNLTLIPRVMAVEIKDGQAVCSTREGSVQTVFPALLTLERSWDLRFPSLFAQKGTVQILSAAELGVDTVKCGLKGSPTQVLESYENTGGRRNCKMVEPGMFEEILRQALEKEDDQKKAFQAAKQTGKLEKIWITDPVLADTARELAEEVVLVELAGGMGNEAAVPARDSADEAATLAGASANAAATPAGSFTDEAAIAAFVQKVRAENPPAILFPSDWRSRCIAPQIAALLETGLCADCTGLLIEDGELHMVRPAFGGNLVAKIRCRTTPAMATVRTTFNEGERLIIGIGQGAKAYKEAIKAYAQAHQGTIAATRSCVEAGEFPYEYQVGLTGKNVSPKVYVALGISGAIHHIVGMECSTTVIAVNKDPEAPIFKYADYGICADVEQIVTDQTPMSVRQYVMTSDL